MLTLYGIILKGQSLHSQFSHSYISVISKPVKDPSKYLGIHLTPSYSSLYSANSPLFLDINKSLQSWTKYPLSLLGRIYVLKMSILPRLLYHFETLPVAIPLAQLKAILKAIHKLLGVF